MTEPVRSATEEECWRMAGLAFRHRLADRPSERLPGWRTIRLEGGLHDPASGFDAACFAHAGRRCLVVAFRGTGEPGGFGAWLSWLTDLATDVSQIAVPEGLARAIRAGVPLPPPPPAGAVPGGQFGQAADLAVRITELYPAWTVTATGFSLGGALAAYAAAAHGLEAVAYAAPGGFGPPGGAARQEGGKEAAGRIRTFLHPCDALGTGPFGEYVRRIGEVYYLEAAYSEANRPYEGHPWLRLRDSIFGDPPLHSLERFRFTPEGGLAGHLVPGPPKEAAAPAPSGSE